MKKNLIYIIFLIIVFIIFIFFTYNPKQKNKKNIYPKYYNKKNELRYVKYKNKNPNMNYNQIIINVNIGLDNNFYENAKKIKNTNEKYILVNKYNYLDKNYIPNNLINIDNTKLVDYVAEEFNKLKESAKKENLNIYAISGYRSYDYQNKIYNNYVKADGREKADTYSARPGHSEHQTGLAIDVSNKVIPYTEFENTKEFIWMQKNAYKYGFILRYPKNKENITGYIYESWHYRYVGIEIATYIKKKNITFDEYYVMNINY